MTDITINDLTTGVLAGSGIFDKLMAASKAHLEDQFLQNRIKGPEYASVYLGQVQQVLQTAVSFLVFQQKAGLEAQLLEQQVLLAKAQVDQATAQTLQIAAQTSLIEQQTANALAEHALIISNAEKTTAEIAQLNEQTKLVTQNIANAAADALNIPKQGLLLDAQKVQAGQQTANLIAEGLNIPKQGELVDAQVVLAVNQGANEVLQGKVLVGQTCLLQAQYDGTLQTTIKTTSETALLNQKVLTERAQIQEMGIDANSVLGRQKDLYAKQSAGFDRDAEQKAVKIWTDTWNARRMTDDGTVADGVNMLNDATGGRLINKMLAGVGA